MLSICYLGFSNFWKFWKLSKFELKILKFVIYPKISKIFKKPEYMWYTLVRWICVPNLKSISSKMTFGGPFECRKRPLFTSFLRIPMIFWFFIFLRFWWEKDVLGSFFAFLTKNWPKNMYYSVRWPKSAVWPFLTSWPEMTLTWPIGYKALEWSFEVSGTRFMPIYWLLIRFFVVISRGNLVARKGSTIFIVTWPVTSSMTPGQ